MAEGLHGAHGLAAVGPLGLRPLMIFVRDCLHISVRDQGVRDEEPRRAHVTVNGSVLLQTTAARTKLLLK
jgi:hypothetical protein